LAAFSGDPELPPQVLDGNGKAAIRSRHLRKDNSMKIKHFKLMAIVALLFLGVSGAAAQQSLGDVARTARKNKAEQAPASRHFDNDNLPTSEGVSVVGPSPAAEAKAGTEIKEATDASAAQRQKAADDWKDKIDKQKAKIDSLNHEVDLDQRELRLRQAALYADPTLRSRNLQWDKDDAQYQTDLATMQEEARKAGVEQQKDTDNSQDKNQK
jgi:hypothetical protein